MKKWSGNSKVLVKKWMKECEMNAIKHEIGVIE